MNSSTSSLNPYAQAYVPIAKREVRTEDEGSKTLLGECGASDDLKLKGQQIDDTRSAPSQNPHQMENKFTDEESEMDLAYLQMMFPGVSDQSLVDVYNVNMGDLEAALDMLNDLELSDNQPDALKTEDAKEPIPSGERLPMKLLNATGESSSSTGSSDLAVAT